MTAAQMIDIAGIDIAGMKAIYGHLQNDPEIEMALQVHGEEKDLVEIGQYMMDGNVNKFNEAIEQKRIAIYHGNTIPITNAIYCLYLPPYYVFVDLKKKYE